MEFEWTRAEVENGTPYYVNHKEGTTTWEHPALTKLLNDLLCLRHVLDAMELNGPSTVWDMSRARLWYIWKPDGLRSFWKSCGIGTLNEIKYAAYRTAAKLHSVQAATNLHLVRVNDLDSTCYDAGYCNRQETVTVAELYNLVTLLFDHIHLEEKQDSVELSVNWMLKCYDSGHTGQLDVGAIKIGLGILCSGTPSEKYAFFFKQVCDGSNMSFNEAKQLMNGLLMVPATVSEKGAFPTYMAEETVQSCFCMNGKEYDDTVTLQEFTLWISKEPQTLVWMPTLYRLLLAATVKHEAKCAMCKTYPIIGFRYRCKKCFNTDLCQNCFWTQKTNRTHKVIHPTKEYCLQATSGDDFRDFASQLRNKITRRYQRKTPKTNYLSISRKAECSMKRTPAYTQLHTRVTTLTQRLNQLEVENMEMLHESREEEEDMRGDHNLEQPERPLEVVSEVLYQSTQVQTVTDDREREVIHLQHHHYIDSIPSRSVLSGGNRPEAWTRDVSVSIDWGLGDEEFHLQELTAQLMAGFNELQSEAGSTEFQGDRLLRATSEICKTLTDLADIMQVD